MIMTMEIENIIHNMNNKGRGNRERQLAVKLI